MNYKTHPGVVMTLICGTPVLIPLRVAYPELQRMIRLPISMVPLWDYLSKGKDIAFYVQQMSMLMKGREESIRKNAIRFCEDYCKLGYMIKVPDDEAADGGQPESECAEAAQNA